MQRRTTDTSKTSQNHASAPHLNPFQTRPFGTDIAKKPETPATDIDFDAQYEHAKSHALNLAHVPVMPPSTVNIQTKSSTDNTIQAQTATNPTHQNFQGTIPGISVAKPLNVPSFQELQNRPDTEQQNIQTRPFVTPNWAVKPSNPVSPVQAKLTIGQPGDKYEQEADHVASQVVQQINAPASVQATQGQPQQQEKLEEKLQAKPEISSLQRMEEPTEELQAKSIIQRREAIEGGEASTDLTSAINSARGGGQPLDVDLQRSMGQTMGANFSGVKVHTDSQSDQLNQSIQAKAFTTGQDVFFRQGAYDPGSRGGQELIAHELTHVVQQNAGAVQRKSLIGETTGDLTSQFPDITSRSGDVMQRELDDNDLDSLYNDKEYFEQWDWQEGELEQFNQYKAARDRENGKAEQEINRNKQFELALSSCVKGTSCISWQLGGLTYHINIKVGTYHVTKEDNPRVHYYFRGFGKDIVDSAPEKGVDKSNSSNKDKQSRFSKLPKDVQEFIKLNFDELII